MKVLPSCPSTLNQLYFPLALSVTLPWPLPNIIFLSLFVRQQRLAAQNSPLRITPFHSLPLTQGRSTTFPHSSRPLTLSLLLSTPAASIAVALTPPLSSLSLITHLRFRSSLSFLNVRRKIPRLRL